MVNKGEYMVIYGAYSRELGKSNAMNGDYSNNEEKMGGIDGFSALVIVLLCMIEYDWLGQVMIGELI